MSATRRVLLTGHRGYLGSVMAAQFVRAGFEVHGLDTDFFGECTLVPDAVEVPGLRMDLRDVTPRDLEGFDVVVHLAALSNDPIGNLNPIWTREINLDASVRLAAHARAAGVERFLFSSSCIMYGMAQAGDVDEESPLDPLTEYARSKVEAERAIAALATDRFSPVFLRNGTVYGLSPRMRFDTVFNGLVGAAVTTGVVTVESDGTPWRPVVHVEDVARAFVAVAEASPALVHNQAINVGTNALNHRVIDLARLAVEELPGARLSVVAQPGADQRTYRANFSKFARLFPSFAFRWTPREGARQLAEAFQEAGLTARDLADPRFTRLKWLRHLLATGRLDASLRWSRRHAEALA
jgi:nucleoside-diphosphate-sugar epimerase